MSDIEQELGISVRDKLNAETGKMEWHELERYYAKGMVIKVDSTLDLIDVAEAIVGDDKDRVSAWMAEEKLGVPKDDEVVIWVENKPLFWAVVVAPWVVIQEIKAT